MLLDKRKIQNTRKKSGFFYDMELGKAHQHDSISYMCKCRRISLSRCYSKLAINFIIFDNK